MVPFGRYVVVGYVAAEIWASEAVEAEELLMDIAEVVEVSNGPGWVVIEFPNAR